MEVGEAILVPESAISVMLWIGYNGTLIWANDLECELNEISTWHTWFLSKLISNQIAKALGAALVSAVNIFFRHMTWRSYITSPAIHSYRQIWIRRGWNSGNTNPGFGVRGLIADLSSIEESQTAFRECHSGVLKSRKRVTIGVPIVPGCTVVSLVVLDARLFNQYLLNHL